MKNQLILILSAFTIFLISSCSLTKGKYVKATVVSDSTYSLNEIKNFNPVGFLRIQDTTDVEEAHRNSGLVPFYYADIPNAKLDETYYCKISSKKNPKAKECTKQKPTKDKFFKKEFYLPINYHSLMDHKHDNIHRVGHLRNRSSAFTDLQNGTFSIMLFDSYSTTDTNHIVAVISREEKMKLDKDEIFNEYQGVIYYKLEEGRNVVDEISTCHYHGFSKQYCREEKYPRFNN